MNGKRAKQIRSHVVSRGTPKEMVNKIARRLRKEYNRASEPIRKQMREEMA